MGIVGELELWKDGGKQPEFDELVVVGLVDCNEHFIEITFKANSQKIYLRFRRADLLREIREARAEERQ